MIALPAAERRETSSFRVRAGRLRRMAALCRTRLGSSWLIRIARGLGLSIALVYGALMLLLPGAEHELTRSLAVAGGEWLVWAASLAALGTARDQQRRDDEDGIVGLLVLRAYPVHQLELGRVLAAAELVASTVLWPAIALASLALILSPTAAALGARLLLGAQLALFAVLLGAVLGPLARWCATSVPGRGRGAFLLAMLAPELLRQAWPATPSVPAFLSDAYGWVLRLGVG